LRFNIVFPFDPRKVLDVSAQVLSDFASKPEVTPKDKADAIFGRLLPECFNATAAGDWDATFHFKIADVGDYTVKVANGQALTTEGLVGTPTCEVATDWGTLSRILKFQILEDASEALPGRGDGTRARAVLKEAGEELDEELSDDMLEMVAGGKGEPPPPAVCGAEHGCTADACGGAACGAAAGGTGACAAAVCGAATGGAGVCAGDVCGAAACVAAAGAGGVCASEACAVAAGAGTACAAAACSTDVCAGAACGAAVGAGTVCAGAVCGADASVGPDWGPCAVNVIPGIPLI
jgi:hypothetical protein